jgi:hypothetical protein
VGAGLVVGPLRERAPRRQPGAHVVDDGDHEDRPRRRKEPRARDGAQRVRRILRRGRIGLRDGLARRALRPPPAAVLPRDRVRRARAGALGRGRPRDEGSRGTRVEAPRRAPRGRRAHTA